MTTRGLLIAGIVSVLWVPAMGGEMIQNPLWEIELNDYGYSDILLDRRSGFEGREYLSGEWAAAVGYKVGSAGTTSPVWLTPVFIYPDWNTNSDFTTSLGGEIAGTGSYNSDGFQIYTSKVANSDLEIEITYQMLDSTTGVEQGHRPASAADPGTSVTSSRYVLSQSYSIKNISGETITELQAFQFLHGLHSAVAIYDDRNYGGAYATYQYDISQTGTSMAWNGGTGQEVELEDVVAFHSAVAPSAWEVSTYDHMGGKPAAGAHISIEGNSLDGTDYYAPEGDPVWVGGAQRYDLVDLLDGESASFDVLLSVSTIPEPATMSLLAVGSVCMLRKRSRRRRRR